MSSSSSEEISSLHPYPLFTSKIDEGNQKKDWVKIGAIIAAVVGGIIAGLAVLCIMGIFPNEMLGGKLGTGVTFISGAAIALPAAMILINKWLNNRD